MNTLLSTTNLPDEQFASMRLGLSWYSTNIWKLPASVQRQFAEYKLLYWNKDYFLGEVYQGCLERDGQIYLIYPAQRTLRHYSNQTQVQAPLEIELRSFLRALSRSHSGQVALSFRRADPEWKLPAVVLVKGVK